MQFSAGFYLYFYILQQAELLSVHFFFFQPTCIQFTTDDLQF